MRCVMSSATGGLSEWTQVRLHLRGQRLALGAALGALVAYGIYAVLLIVTWSEGVAGSDQPQSSTPVTLALLVPLLVVGAAFALWGYLRRRPPSRLCEDLDMTAVLAALEAREHGKRHPAERYRPPRAYAVVRRDQDHQTVDDLVEFEMRGTRPQRYRVLERHTLADGRGDGWLARLRAQAAALEASGGSPPAISDAP